MNIAHIEKHSFIYGPGCRFVIWVQGCSIRCPGCWNQDMWEFEPRQIMTVENLLSEIFEVKSEIEGITILGGEPFDQYYELFNFIKKVRTENLSIMLYTGYEIDELYAKKMDEIMKFVDILISGRYEQSKRTLYYQWIGSTNQKISFISSRYSDYSLDNANYNEIDIDAFGKITIYGYPEENFFLETDNFNYE